MRLSPAAGGPGVPGGGPGPGGRCCGEQGRRAGEPPGRRCWSRERGVCGNRPRPGRLIRRIGLIDFLIFNCRAVSGKNASCFLSCCWVFAVILLGFLHQGGRPVLSVLGVRVFVALVVLFQLRRRSLDRFLQLLERNRNYAPAWSRGHSSCPGGHSLCSPDGDEVQTMHTCKVCAFI